MIAISNEYTNEHGLSGCAFNPPKIQPVWRGAGHGHPMKTIKDLPEHSRPLDIQREIDAERGLVESNWKLVS